MPVVITTRNSLPVRRDKQVYGGVYNYRRTTLGGSSGAGVDISVLGGYQTKLDSGGGLAFVKAAGQVVSYDTNTYVSTDLFELTGSAPNQYIRAKYPLASDGNIRAHADTGWLPPTIWESLPKASTDAFGVVKIGSNLTCVAGVLSANPQGIGTYPTPGLVVSNGSAWLISIVDNSDHWNEAYTHSVGGHAYLPLVGGVMAGSIRLDSAFQHDLGEIQTPWNDVFAENFKIRARDNSVQNKGLWFYDSAGITLQGRFGAYWDSGNLSFQFIGINYNDTSAKFYPNGEAQLFYDNSIKLATKTGGVNVTGEFRASGNIVAHAS